MSCAATFVQDAAFAALIGSHDAVGEMTAFYRARRDVLGTILQGVPGITLTPTEGTFYAFADIRGTRMESATFADWLLEQARVAVVPGAAFGAAGEGHVRISLAVAALDFDVAVSRLAKALTDLSHLRGRSTA